VLAQDERILDMKFPVNWVGNGASVAYKFALSVRTKVSTLQDPGNTTVYHVLHQLTHSLVRLDSL
jgi:hypothetical protein